ncbi:aromatic acid exporter family protein [Halalkalibacillus sediminis]|uniref:Aromatic acid exporter family protein n=1 Tax=Halalkalibacillus sediminis TaxID=2018042 RepID=A0A2I0QRK0_9BACI|nr:aromatic acid exporter family protein [Halalkalibacillus sediminis]PKR76967.1 aromatic acid exporter family protein [Halalkalibacillus sediminis]
MKVGARALKTGVSTAIALYVASYFGFDAGLFAAAIAAVSSIQPSIYRSYQMIIEQLQANFIGAGIAVLLVLTVGNDPFLLGVGIILSIGTCMIFKMKEDTTFIAIIAVIAIMESTSMAFMDFAAIRFTSILIGIASAFLVNLVFLPPKYETRLFEMINHTTSDIMQWIRVTTRHLSDQPALKKEINRLERDLAHLEQTYLLYSEERSYSRKKGYRRARKLVLFRQLVNTSRKSFQVLQTLHRMDYEIGHIKGDLNEKIVEEVDKTLHTHEKLILMYLGRIRKKTVDPLGNISEPDIPSLVNQLMDIYDEGEKDRFVLLPLASTLMDYHNELIHLKKLLVSYLNSRT